MAVIAKPVIEKKPTFRSRHVNITPTGVDGVLETIPMLIDQDQGSSGRWQLLALPGASANAPPCLPWVGFQDVGDTKLHLRDLQAFTCRE